MCQLGEVLADLRDCGDLIQRQADRLILTGRFGDSWVLEGPELQRLYRHIERARELAKQIQELPEGPSELEPQFQTCQGGVPA